ALVDAGGELVHAAFLVQDPVAGPHDGIGHPAVEDLHLQVREGGGLLDHHHPADEVRDVADRGVGDREVLDRPDGVDPVIGVRRHLSGPEEVFFHTGLVHLPSAGRLGLAHTNRETAPWEHPYCGGMVRTRSPGRVLGRAPTPGQALPSARAALHPQEGVLGSVIDRGGLPLPGRTWPIFGIAFVGFATPVIGFVELAERVTDGAKLPFDRPVMLWLRRRHSSGTTRFVRAVTELGGVTAVPVFALAAAGYLAYVRGSRRPAALL